MFNLNDDYILSDNPLSNDKILDLSEFKEFVDKDFNLCSNGDISCLEKDKKHCRKRSECWYPPFVPFSTIFSVLPL